MSVSNIVYPWSDGTHSENLILSADNDNIWIIEKNDTGYWTWEETGDIYQRGDNAKDNWKLTRE